MGDPLLSFLDVIDALEDPNEIAGHLAELALHADRFEPLIGPMDPDGMGGAALHVPDEGPRLFLMHRPRGVMSYVHSHGTWVIVAPVRGVETHLRYDVEELKQPDRARLVVADERRLAPGQAAVVVPPDDIHSHGHAGGDDEVPYTLILTGEDQTRFARREYDVEAGTYRELPPGDFGTLNLP